MPVDSSGKKKTYSYLLLSLVCLSAMLPSCSGKKQKQNDIIIADKYVPKKPQEPIRLQPLSFQQELQWGGSSYVVKIERQPNDSLPLVKGAQGQEYVDNNVLLTVTRSDGSQFFSHLFTKQSFDACLDNTFRHQGILDGMAYDTIAPGNLRFGVNVAFPETDDMYMPIVLTLDRQGRYSIARDDSTEF